MKSLKIMNEIQNNITLVWQKVLKVNNIPLNGKFFEFGGNSIKAMLIIANLSNKFGIDLDIHDIFENPTIGKLSKKVESQLIDDKSKILPIPHADNYALSHAQTRLWLISQNEPHSIAYNVHIAFLLKGNLCIDSFRKAFEKIVEKHESLRTTFDLFKTEVRQIIHKNITLPLEIIDLSGCYDSKKQAEIIYLKEAKALFDLKNGPLFRIKLINLGKQAGDQSYVFIFNAHHIICDGWSNNILLKELNYFYQAYKKNEYVNLEPLPIQYKDFAAWQNRFITSEAINPHRNYWLKKLSGELLPPLSLASPGYNNKDFNGQWYSFRINKMLRKKIDNLCVNHNITFYTLMVAVIKVILSYHSSQKDIIIASPVAERTHPELISQIGCYLNTLILRDSIRNEESFAKLVKKVKKTISEGLKHQIYPVDILINDICINNKFIQSLFSVVLNVVEDYHGNSVKLDNIHITKFIEISLTSRSDLNITFVTSESIEVVIEYRSTLFSAKKIQQIRQHILLLLNAVINNFDTQVLHLKEILSNKNKHK